MVIVTLPDGRKVEATQADFTLVKEEWNEYRLPDGMVVKMKLAVTEIYVLAESDKSTDKPNLMVKHNILMATTLPEGSA
jgi:hypothetical protein